MAAVTSPATETSAVETPDNLLMHVVQKSQAPGSEGEERRGEADGQVETDDGAAGHPDHSRE